jgi:hypothetical protein
VTAYALSHAALSHDEDTDRWQAAYRYFGEVANTEARANVTRDVDWALREVAPTVLGLEFPEPRCSEDRLDTDPDDLPDDSPASGVDRPPVRVLTDGSRSSSGSGSGSAGSLASGGDRGSTNTGFGDGGASFSDSSGSWDSPGSGSTTTPAVSTSIPADASVSKCNSRLVPMRAAPEYLNDPEWCAGIASPTLARLRSAFATFAALGGGDTDPPPVPPPD